jgi:hypothetical protein
MQLNIDPKRPYHYIIGVGVKSMRHADPGKLYLKYGPLKFTNDDVKKVRDAKVLSEDKLFPTSSKEALDINECSEVVGSLTAMTMAARANDCTLHHFSSEFPFRDEDFETIVNSANVSKSSMKLLKDSKITY